MINIPLSLHATESEFRKFLHEIFPCTRFIRNLWKIARDVIYNKMFCWIIKEASCTIIYYYNIADYADVVFYAFEMCSALSVMRYWIFDRDYFKSITIKATGIIFTRR